MDSVGELEREAIKNEIKIRKKRKIPSSKYDCKYFTYITSSNLKTTGRDYYYSNFTHEHTSEKNQLICHTISHSNPVPELVSPHTVGGRESEPHVLLKAE